MTTDAPIRLCLFGAAPGTGNLGVEALFASLVDGLAARLDSIDLAVFDNGRGERREPLRAAGRPLMCRRIAAVCTRRIYRRDSLWMIRTAGRVGFPPCPALDAVRRADAILDLTSGDSFTDLYGARRFRIVVQEKQIALEQGVPLLLLPQTIGPFRDARTADVARGLLRASTMVWSRDRRSDAAVQDLLGATYDPARHRCGPDLAFGLRAQTPDTPLPGPLAGWLERRDARPLVGINVSGLLFNDVAAAARQYRLRADYRRVVIDLVTRLLDETDANIVLVPHVMTHPDHFEHDPDACRAVRGEIGAAARDRIADVPAGLDCRATKWLIGRTDWFCGTRMHATIAALSSGVPAAAIAYSPKHAGVFATAGQDAHVADPREDDTDAVVERLFASWIDRDAARARLAAALPVLRDALDDQMDDIVDECRRAAAPAHRAPARAA